MVICAVFAPILAPFDPSKQSLVNTLLPLSAEHILGTDEFGRDELSRVIFAARASLTVGLFSTTLSGVIGTAIGLIAGYRGGWVDEVLMRLMDGLFSFPSLMLALVINAMLGASLTNAIIAIAVVSTPTFARLARGSTITIREADYVLAARALGVTGGGIIFRHILPNILTPLIVQGTNQISDAIITEGALSFLGLGVQPPTPSWGNMLRDGYSYTDSSPWLVLAPGLALVVAVFGFNFLGDAIRDALELRSLGR